MNIYTRVLILSAMAAVSLTQGCSCSSDDDPEPIVLAGPSSAASTSSVVSSVTTSSSAPATVAVGGVAAKGLLMSAQVSACLVPEDKDCVNPVATALTDVNGSYQLTIPQAHVGKPLLVRISAGDNTTMKCDLADGCGMDANMMAIPFGGIYPVPKDPGFEMDAMIPEIKANGRVNVTALTNLAAKLVQLRIGESDLDLKKAIIEASSQIASRFNLLNTTDITQIEPVDLTNPAQLGSSNSDRLRAALFSSAIVAATRADNVGDSIFAALKKFTEKYASAGLLTNAQTGSFTDLKDILRSADAILARAIQGNPALARQLVAISVAIQAAALEAANSPASDEGASKGDISPNLFKTPGEKVRAMVKVLGDVGGAINAVNLGGDKGDIETQLDAFEMQLEAAELATSEGVEYVLNATAQTAEAMGDAYDAYEANTALTSWTSPDDITVTIAPMKEGNVVKSVSLSVKQAVEAEVDGQTANVMIDMMGTEMHSHTETTLENGNEKDVVSGTLALKGTAEEAHVKLTVKDGSTVSLGESMSIYSEANGKEIVEATASEPKFDLKVSLKQMGMQLVDPITFDGSLYFHATQVSGVDTDNGNGTGETTLQVGAVKFTLSGALSNTTGDSAGISLVITGDATGVTFKELWAGNSETTSDNETDTKFAGLAASLNVTANLANVADVVAAGFMVSRKDKDTSTQSLSLSWPKYWLKVAAEVTDEDDPISIAVTNQDGVVAGFRENEEGDWVGDFKVGDQVVATFENALVTYKDGGMPTTESLDVFEEEDVVVPPAN